MSEWSTACEIQTKPIENYHKKHQALLNKLRTAINEGQVSQAMLDTILNGLFDYASEYFAYEELLMQKMAVETKHSRLHKMEHHAFLYDIEKMSHYFAQENSLMETAEKLWRFMCRWLKTHLQKTDQQLKEWIRLKNLEQFYLHYKQHASNETNMNLLLNSLLAMWKKVNVTTTSSCQMMPASC